MKLTDYMWVETEVTRAPLSALEQWRLYFDWSSTCYHCSNTSQPPCCRLCLSNWVWAGVDRTQPCVGTTSPDSRPKVSSLCFLLSSGMLFEPSHTMARLNICGQQIEMQVVMVRKMIDAFLMISHELEHQEKDMVQGVHAEHAHALLLTWREACGGQCIWSVRACREKKGKGGLYI